MELERIHEILKSQSIDDENLAIALAQMFKEFSNDESLKRNVVKDIDRINNDLENERKRLINMRLNSDL
ncbi:hypothetical protein [Staphylococcus nepalensis]|uniref:hypothetical protein n=1 Tax=Staphylococcus nepalensis TaxID=214473 RepID=UPI000E02F649|nr:hypothetical protein [Staphylococcus nepalensis]RIO43895.1 hypothetical protein BUZ60_03525 [Staphylococcus nepalensis]SUM69881.1 Uncharacterised protein [Staphylococcus nepalensis]SUM96094.1 Uncharacterised protein [Staphylococcus nepalensis]